MSTVIKVENLSKHYNLGNIGSNTLRDDLAMLWAKTTGKQYETHKIGENVNNINFWALKDINFEVQQGEVLGIIGKNGAGKSTLLKILSKVTAPTSGQVKIKGRIASLLEVGTGFHPELTGRENIFMNGAILGMTKREITSKFDEIVNFSGIAQFIDTPVKRYSSGMYVRLAFAVAAHLEPEILIIDEVLAVGDAEFQKKCLGKMKDVSGEGRTVLFVSHDMGAISKLCSKTLMLKNGGINYHGGTSEAIKIYLSGNILNNQNQSVEQLPREFLKYGKRLKISDFSFTKPHFYWKEQPGFQFSFKLIDTSLGNIEFGFRISSADGTPVFTHESKKTHSTNSEKISVNISQPQLVPGKYFFTLGVRSNTETLDALVDFASFEVLEVDESGKSYGFAQPGSFAGYIDSEIDIN